MAVQAYTEVPGMTQAQYDGMFQQAGGKLRVAPGFIAHLGTPMDGGMAVTELWESQEAAEAFLTANVYPMIEAAGMPMIHPQFRPIHNLVFARK
jgi:heme-degrading monooxygenase HmoA